MVCGAAKGISGLSAPPIGPCEIANPRLFAAPTEPFCRYAALRCARAAGSYLAGAPQVVKRLYRSTATCHSFRRSAN